MAPKVRIGGAALACCAGTVNAIAFHAIGSFVSHQTGSFSRVGFGDMDALLLVASFVFGALVCGSLVSHNGNMRVPLYDICLIIQAGLLVATTFLAEHWVARYLAAVSCGLQNGLATHWGGAVVRTTHVTGLFTDVGLLAGRLLSLLTTRCCRLDSDDTVAAADDLSKLSVLGTIATAFLAGIILGTHCFLSIGHYAFLIPAVAVGSFGCAYLCYRVFGQCFSSKEEMEMDKDIEMDEAAEMDEDVEAASLEAGGDLFQADAMSKGSDTPTSLAETREGSGELPDLEKAVSEN
jgi:uncharacterized membrane protein YoaK (UPF0700 family)